MPCLAGYTWKPRPMLLLHVRLIRKLINGFDQSYNQDTVIYDKEKQIFAWSDLYKYVNEGKFYLTMLKTSCLYGSTPRSTNASTTNVDKASLQIIRLLDRSRTGVPDKERRLEFYMETIRTTRIISILVSLVVLGQGDTYGYKYKAPLGGEGTRNNKSRHKINVQANIRQDKPSDIDIRDMPRPTLSGTYRGRP
uniref:Uncharacterized protein n=2 Tax=Oryza sativa subsp. japonica TaxID=39947 RepID=Q75IY6_ORYSJ|nr:hypothetical protein OSJNBa0039N21.18 [Oryza sativa Japonica Group]ABF96599.1 hypothetical protein LOC_Os03g30088 [Oryza sativa Japonica Group]